MPSNYKYLILAEIFLCFVAVVSTWAIGVSIFIYYLADFFGTILIQQDRGASSAWLIGGLAAFVIPGFFGVTGLIAFVYYLLKGKCLMRNAYTVFLLTVGSLPLIFMLVRVDEVSLFIYVVFAMPLSCTAHLLLLLLNDMRQRKRMDA